MSCWRSRSLGRAGFALTLRCYRIDELAELKELEELACCCSWPILYVRTPFPLLHFEIDADGMRALARS